MYQSELKLDKIQLRIIAGNRFEKTKYQIVLQYLPTAYKYILNVGMYQ